MQVAPHKSPGYIIVHVAAVGAVHGDLAPSARSRQHQLAALSLHCHTSNGQPTASLAMQGVWEIIAQARKARCPDALQLYVALVKAAAAAMGPGEARFDAACGHVSLDVDMAPGALSLADYIQYSSILDAHPFLPVH